MKTWNEMSGRERDALVAEKVFERSISRSMTWGRLLMFREETTGLTEEIPPYTTSWDGAHLVIQYIKGQVIYSKRQRFWQEVQRIVSKRIKMQGSLVDWPDAFFFLEPDIPGLAALRALEYEIEENLVNKEAAIEHANRLLIQYGQQRWGDQARLQLAIYGTIADIYRVEARFAHIDGPVIYETDGDKPDAYQRVADLLMSENIQRMLVYKNGQLAQTITIDNPQNEKETPNGTDKEN